MNASTAPSDNLSAPALSIVTIHLNQPTELRKTLRSLELTLQHADIEWVVKDGGTVPDTAEDRALLEQVEHNARHFSQQPDDGIYDAMNQATALTRGRWVMYINAGDELHPQFDWSKLQPVLAHSTAGMIWGQCEEQYANGRRIVLKTRSPRWAWYGMPAQHPAIVFRRDLLGDRPYETRFQMAADYALVSRLLVADAEVLSLASPMAIFHRGGVSDTNSRLTRSEENQVRLQYYRVPLPLAWLVQRFKAMNRQLAKVSWLRGIWRRWI